MLQVKTKKYEKHKNKTYTHEELLIVHYFFSFFLAQMNKLKRKNNAHKGECMQPSTQLSCNKASMRSTMIQLEVPTLFRTNYLVFTPYLFKILNMHNFSIHRGTYQSNLNIYPK